MAPTRKLQAQLFKEMFERIRLSDAQEEEAGEGEEARLLGEPGGDGWVYYSRRPRGHNFPIYCRRPATDGSDQENGEEVLLDQNGWPEFYQRMVLGDAKVSPRQTRLAFLLNTPEKGGKGWALYVQDLRGSSSSSSWWTVEGGAWAGVGPSFEWGPKAVGAGNGGGKEEEVLYYTRVDAHGRPHEAWAAFLPLATGRQNHQGLSRPPRRVLGLDPVKDGASFLTAARTKDRRFVTLAATSKTSSEVWLLPGPNSTTGARTTEEKEAITSPRLFCPRRPGVQYFVDHGEDAFFIVANAEPGGEYGLYTLPTQEAGALSSLWRPCSSHDGGVDGSSSSSIEDMDLFRGYCVLYERSHRAGAPTLRVLDRRYGCSTGPIATAHRPTLPPAALVGKLQPGMNQDYDVSHVRFSISSPILPDVAYEYDMRTRRLQELYREQLPGRPPLDTDATARYSCQRVLVPTGEAENEVTIPLTLAHRRDVQPGPEQRHPVLLLGYGAYGVCLSVGYRPELLPLLDRGVVVAMAHVRGGGEKGRAWHAAGKGENKANSLLDYQHCADWLVEAGWTQPGLIAGYGASAGALVVAGAAHRRPELFGALVLKHSFLDLHRTMADPTLPLTVHEYDEWGDPRNAPAVAARLAALSPYDTVPAEAPSFPPTLLLASLADDRVKGWEAAKYAAKAREMRCHSGGGGPEVLLRMEGDRGHEGPPSQAEMLMEAAFEQAFVLTRMGVVGLLDGGDDGPKEVNRGGARRRQQHQRGRGMCLPPVPPLAFW